MVAQAIPARMNMAVSSQLGLNWNVLPEQVGLNLQTTGEYAQYISKQMAVYGPMGVTGGCLAMMFLSRKTVYPWMICMFSMLLPLLILLTNIFPS